MPWDQLISVSEYAPESKPITWPLTVVFSFLGNLCDSCFPVAFYSDQWLSNY